MSRFRLGTLSASAALFTTVFLVLFGPYYAVLIPPLVYAVPCSAAFRKSPARFWRTFTVVSVLIALVATAVCTLGLPREIDGVLMIGFPLPQPVDSISVFSLPFAVNAVLASGVCLFPLCLLSTLDTLRTHRRKRHYPRLSE
jgi:hypothetical protein